MTHASRETGALVPTVKISEDRAYWLLNSYRNRATVLDFGGSILGQEEYCNAMIIEVDRETHILVIELFERGDTKKWVRPIQLAGARLRFSMLGETGFNEWAGFGWYAVLEITFLDSTLLVFAESIR
jgi:hypothetical protein